MAGDMLQTREALRPQAAAAGCLSGFEPVCPARAHRNRRSHLWAKVLDALQEDSQDRVVWITGALGGDREASTLDNMDLDSYATALKRARQMGSLTGFMSGADRMNSSLTKSNLRAYEEIIAAMTPEEKADLSLFGAASRQRVAQQAGCNVGQVDDCIAKYEWMKLMSSKMAALKRSGRPLPKTMDEVERTLGSWRGFKQQQLEQAQTSRPTGKGKDSALQALELLPGT